MPQDVASVEIVTAEALGAINTAEIDTQVATAKKWPRDIAVFTQQATQMATVDERTASECLYTFRRGDKNINGPSIRLAEIVLSCFKNVRSGTRIIGIDKDHVTAQGAVLDVENNAHFSTEVLRSIRGRSGARYSNDMIMVTAMAAQSIALRNSVFRAVPQGIVAPIIASIKQVIAGDASSLGERRVAALKYLEGRGVPPERVFARLGREGVESITLNDLVVLKGILTHVNENSASLQEEFPDPAAQSVRGMSLSEQVAAAQAKQNLPEEPHDKAREALKQEVDAFVGESTERAEAAKPPEESEPEPAPGPAPPDPDREEATGKILALAKRLDRAIELEDLETFTMEELEELRGRMEADIVRLDLDEDAPPPEDAPEASAGPEEPQGDEEKPKKSAKGRKKK